MTETTKAKAELARRMADRRRELIARPLSEIWEELAAVAMGDNDSAPQSGMLSMPAGSAKIEKAIDIDGNVLGVSIIMLVLQEDFEKLPDVHREVAKRVFAAPPVRSAATGDEAATLAGDIEELNDVIQAVRGDRSVLRVSGFLGDREDVGVIGIDSFDALSKRLSACLRATTTSPTPNLHQINGPFASPVTSEAGEETVAWAAFNQDGFLAGTTDNRETANHWASLGWTMKPLAYATPPAPAPDAVREVLPLADHDQISRNVLGLPWAIQSAVVTIAAHCTVIRDKQPSGDVADLAACISMDLAELSIALKSALSRPAEGASGRYSDGEDRVIERCAQLCEDAGDRILAVAIRALKAGADVPAKDGGAAS